MEIDGNPCIKISLDMDKVTIPRKKELFRIYGREGYALLDIMQGSDEELPKINQKILCRHPFESKLCYATPSKVESLLQLWWSNGKVGGL